MSQPANAKPKVITGCATRMCKTQMCWLAAVAVTTVAALLSARASAAASSGPSLGSVAGPAAPVASVIAVVVAASSGCWLLLLQHVHLLHHQADVFYLLLQYW